MFLLFQMLGAWPPLRPSLFDTGLSLLLTEWSNADAVRQRLESVMSQVSLISHHIREHGTGDDADGSLYVGPAGIAFAFYHKAMNFQVMVRYNLGFCPDFNFLMEDQRPAEAPYKIWVNLSKGFIMLLWRTLQKRPKT